MPSKRQVLQSLARSTLLYIARNFEVPGLTAKRREEIIYALMGFRGIRLDGILMALRAGDLKDLCREFGAAPKSCRKEDMARALCGDGPENAPARKNISEKKPQMPIFKGGKTGKKKISMPKTEGRQKNLEQYTHDKAERVNNPPVGLVTPMDFEWKRFA